MKNLFNEREIKELMTNYYDTKDIKDILKEVKKYLKQKKSNDEICELIGGTSCDTFIFGDEEITHITISKTRYVGNFLKKNLTPDFYDIKKIKQDIIEESITITIDFEEKEIIAETSIIIEYKDRNIEKSYYKIAHIKF